MKTRPFITERLLMGRKESNQTKQKKLKTSKKKRGMSLKFVDSLCTAHDGLTISTMLSTGQVSVIITTSLFLYDTGPEVFRLY